MAPMLKHLTFLLTFAGILTQNAYAAEITYGIFKDRQRSREIPYKLYAPVSASEPAPVVIFSHGLGGSTEAAPYLGHALAENGYYAFFIQHPGSDKSVWEGKGLLEIKKALRESIATPESAINRYNDLPFVVDELERLNRSEGPLHGRLDLSRIGMAGHSFGARSVMAAAGEAATFGGPAFFKDPRIKAAIALSPNVPERSADTPAAELSPLYRHISIPLFHVTGTKDGHPFRRDFDPATRTKPYQAIEAPDQYLLVLDGAEHSTFGGHKRGHANDAAYRKTVAEGAVLFFDAYLKGNREALARLREDFPKGLALGDRFEFK